MSYSSPHPARPRRRVADRDRQRAAKACWRCRDRKSRCIVIRTEKSKLICQRCVKRGWECIFDENADVDGVFSSESLNGVRETSRNRQYAPTPGSNASSSAVSKPHSSSDTVIFPPKSGRQQSLPPSPSKRLGEGARLLVKNSHQTHYVGEVSNGTFLSKVQDAVVAESPVEIRNDIPSEYIQSLDSNSTDSELLRTALESFPPKTVADFLVSTFFHTVEANYYYMDRSHFKERLERCYLDTMPDDLDASFVCLALMVFAMGSQFADLQAPSKLISSMSVSRHGPGMVFYVKTKSLLSDVITQCSLESIQVCFLIALFLLPSNTSDLSYVYHGMALKMAIAGGLHRKILHTNLDRRIVHVRNRLWWSLYTSERRLTIILDRPESIREEDIDTPFPEFCEELDLPHAQDNISNLQASIQLTRIFNRVARLGKAFDFAEKEAESSIAEINHDLDNWHSNLPAGLQLNNLDPEGKSFRGKVHLHMTYNQIIIYMSRTALLRRIQARLKLAHGSETGAEAPEKNIAEEALSRSCVAAAYKIVDLVRYLAESHKLARFSFTDLNCCSTAGVIVIIYEIIRRHPLYNCTISSILQSMQFMASGCQNAKHGLKLVQNLVSLTAAIKNKSPSLGPPGGGDTAGREYRQWENWMAEAENWGTENRGQSNSVGAPVDAHTNGWQAVVEAADPNGASGYTASRLQNSVAASIPYMEEGYVSFETQNYFLSQPMSQWSDDLNLLGLAGFEELGFSNITSS